jgi:hypothetical protein
MPYRKVVAFPQVFFGKYRYAHFSSWEWPFNFSLLLFLLFKLLYLKMLLLYINIKYTVRIEYALHFYRLDDVKNLKH